jgi:hypothetical protein
MTKQNDRNQGFFNKKTVVALMSELAEAMAADGIGAKIVIVGGGALCFVYDRQATTDIDAAIYPKEVVTRYAAEIARKHGLRPDWLNDNAVGFFPHDDPATIPVVTVGDVTVERADTDVLLAMKLRACRPRKDLFDLAILLRHHDVRSLAEAEAWLDRFFPEEQVGDPAIVEAALGAITLPTDPPADLETVRPRDTVEPACRQWVLNEDGRCVLPSGHQGDHTSYNQMLWMLDPLKGATYPPS